MDGEVGVVSSTSTLPRRVSSQDLAAEYCSSATRVSVPTADSYSEGSTGAHATMNQHVPLTRAL